MPQVARPASDVSVGGWTTDTGAAANLYQAIDEASFSDADYVRSDQSSDPDAYVIGLGPLVDPGINTGHTINLRQRKDSAGGDTTDLDVIFQAGDWDVHTESYDDIDETINAVSFTLGSAEVDEFRAHGGYANPRVKMVRRKRASITTNTGVTYTTSPSTLTCDIRRPASGGPFPVVMMCVDGGFTDNTFFYAQDEAIRLAQEEGFATIIFQIRVVPGALAPAPMEDCADLVDFIVANAATYNFDANRIAAMGGSGGGYVAAFLAMGTYLTAGQLARVKCAVAMSPPTDFRNGDVDGCQLPEFNDWVTDFVGVTEALGPATWDAMSPVYNVAAGSKPIFIVHFAVDPITPAQGQRLAAALAAGGIEYRMLTYAGSNHGWGITGSAAAWAEMVTWLHRYLG